MENRSSTFAVGDYEPLEAVTNDVEPFRCPRCSAVLEPETSVCPHCGNKLW